MRLFVAFELPDSMREEAGRWIAEVRRGLPPARWVRPEGLHLTLKFLGETAEDALGGLGAALAPAFAAAPALTARLADGGCFPPGRPARVAWIGVAVERADGASASSGPGVRDGGEALAALQRRVDEAAAEALGLERDRRPFSPHVTLARPNPPWRRPAVEAFARASTAPLPGRLGETFLLLHGALVESRLGPRGARYRTLAAYPLAA